MAHRSFRLVCAAALLLCACDPSDLKAWIEGNRDIPDAWDAFIPEAARDGLIDAEIGDKDVKLRYHSGEWTAVLASFESPLTDAGYTKMGTCPSSDGEDVASVAYAKLVGDGNADVVNVGLSVYLKASGHYFINVQRNEFVTMFLPEGCTFTDEATEVCENPGTGSCTFLKE